MGELQHSPDVLVTEFVKRIQVHPQRPREQNWILCAQSWAGQCTRVCYRPKSECLLIYFAAYLWYDSELVSQVMQAYRGNIYTVNEDATFSCFNNSKQAICETWFPSSCAAHYTNLNATRENTKDKTEWLAHTFKRFHKLHSQTVYLWIQKGGCYIHKA